MRSLLLVSLLLRPRRLLLLLQQPLSATFALLRSTLSIYAAASFPRWIPGIQQRCQLTILRSLSRPPQLCAAFSLA
uniref:Putative secreted protein n=1 Tax=Anopheles triannulatus TaxID=58253 RepID=A0A2M4B3X8_9DIPT